MVKYFSFEAVGRHNCIAYVDNSLADPYKNTFNICSRINTPWHLPKVLKLYVQENVFKLIFKAGLIITWYLPC